MKDEMQWLDIFRGYYLNYLKDNNKKINHSFNPICVGYKIIERCNQKCKHCWAGKETKTKSLKEIKYAIDKISLLKPYMLGISGGEPFMHPNCVEILEYSTKRFPVVELLTNAELLNDELILQLSCILRKNDFLQISMDGMRDNYFFQRGNDSFDKVIVNVKNLIFKNIRVRLHMTVTGINLDDMINIYNLAKDLNVNTFSMTYVYPLRKGKQFINIDDMKIYYKNAQEIEKIHSESKSNMHLSIFYPIETKSILAKKSYNVNAIVPNFDIFHWTIDGNGEIFNFMDYFFDDLKIGNIYTDNIEKLLATNYEIQGKLLYRDLSETKCRQCSILDTCMGGDFINNYPNINQPDRRCLFNV